MNRKIKPRVRLVIIKDNKLLLTHTSDGDFYFYIGGKVEFGETLEQACVREIKEECGEEINFLFKKVLYIRDYIKPDEDEHSVEFYILGDIDKVEGIEQKIDPEFVDIHKQVWVDMNNIPENIFPQKLTEILLKDYKNGFPMQGEYLGVID
jgi:ADP-ribose pyrophosphatase YjhB (NUDIX family)